MEIERTSGPSTDKEAVMTVDDSLLEVVKDVPAAVNLASRKVGTFVLMGANFGTVSDNQPTRRQIAFLHSCLAWASWVG